MDRRLGRAVHRRHRPRQLHDFRLLICNLSPSICLRPRRDNPRRGPHGQTIAAGKSTYLSISSNAKRPSANGCEVSGLELSALNGYGSVVMVGKPQIFPVRKSTTTLPYSCLLPSGDFSICTPGSIYTGYATPLCASAEGGAT